jgi:hypothetical protein
MMPSLTTENYLKAIYQIGGDDCDHVVSTGAVAQPFRLIRVLDQSSEFLRFLTESGIELAAVGVVVQHLPHAATTTISINNHSTTLSDLVASKLVVAATE